VADKDFETLKDEMSEVVAKFYAIRRNSEPLSCPECQRTFSIYNDGIPPRLQASCDHRKPIENAYDEMIASRNFG